MDRRGIRDDVAPWSFFLPVALAVIVGGLVAGLLLRGIDFVLASGSDRYRVEGTHRPGPAATSEASASAPEPRPQAEPPPHAAAAGNAPAQASPEAEAASATAVPVLPGAIVARRDGAPEACISGSIALRAENGWEQRLENDAPVPCVEQSATAR